MKKIVPFNNILTFSTDVREITAISLEHNLKIAEDIISGSFYITGEYKITDGDIKREEFDFELPFDIALSQNYDLNTLIVDIDDFRYELIERNKLKVSIDLYIDGEIIPEPIEVFEEDRTSDESEVDCYEVEEEAEETYFEEELAEPTNNVIESIDSSSTIETTNYLNQEVKETIIEEPMQMPIQERIDLLDEMLTSSKEEEMKEENINLENENINTNVFIFNSFNEDENYVTYRVYRVLESDTIDKILEKYNITKEELANYNNIEDIKPGDKLIIPANDK